MTRPLNIVLIGMIIASTSLTYWTLNLAFKNPVQLDNSFFNDYHSLNRNYPKIQERELEFNKKFIFKYEFIGNNQNRELKFEVINKSNLDTYLPSDIHIKSLLTRPNTNVDNLDLKFEKKNDSYIIPLHNIAKGRWQVMLQIEIKNSSIFQKLEFFVE
jgi:hypothetical protein